MQRRDFLGISIAAGLSMAGLAGCSKSGPLAFGLHPWIGYEPLYLAENFGWLPKSIVLRTGSSSSDSMAGLLSGELGGAALTLMKPFGSGRRARNWSLLLLRMCPPARMCWLFAHLLPSWQISAVNG